MKLSALAAVMDGVLQGQDTDFQAISKDSRQVNPGDCFFAIRGEFFDGHDFLPDVAKKKAAVAIVDRAVTLPIPIIRVENTRTALILLAKQYRAMASAVPVIGITGSCGKTTTRVLVQAILQQSGNVLASQKSFNNDIGLPLTLLRFKPEHQCIVLEIGMN